MLSSAGSHVDALGSTFSDPPIAFHEFPLSAATRICSTALEFFSGHTTIGAAPIDAMSGGQTSWLGSTLGLPPRMCQAPPLKDATRTSRLPSVVRLSDQATYGTPPISMMLGVSAFWHGEKFRDPPTGCHDAPSNDLTRILLLVPSNSAQAAYGTPPTPVMLESD